MSQITSTVCDGCDTPAPRDYNFMFPRHGWLHVFGRRDDGGVDVCSWACLATVVAARITASAEL